VGVAQGEPLLGELLEESGAEVRGLCLRDSAGHEVVVVGECPPLPPARELELFLGRFAGESRTGPGGAWRHGRGRYSLEVFLAPRAGRPPLASRLVVPAAAGVGLAMLGLALFGARLLERQRRLELEAVDRRRLEGLARAGAGLAHQLRTPLATIKGSCQLVQEEYPDGPWARRVGSAVREAERMERTLSLLLDYARPPQPQPTSIALASALHDLVDRFGALKLSIPEDLRVTADPEHLQQLLGNLLENANQVSPEDAPVSVTAARVGDEITIQVVDHGPGPGEDPEELFEPYVTRRADGTGLGLPMARTLAEVNGGTVTLHRGEHRGCVARLVLPAAGAAP